MIGAILAGGAGSRLGRSGEKPAAELAGRPLVTWPLAAVAAACAPVVVVCKASTPLPELAGVERWNEPDEPRHPLTGIVHALERAGAPVLVCAADMPYVTSDACLSLMAAARSGAARAAVAVADGMLQPVFGVYAPAALAALRDAPEGAPLRRTIEGLEPARVALPPALLRSVNSPRDLEEAEAELGGQPRSKT